MTNFLCIKSIYEKLLGGTKNVPNYVPRRNQKPRYLNDNRVFSVFNCGIHRPYIELLHARFGNFSKFKKLSDAGIIYFLLLDVFLLRCLLEMVGKREKISVNKLVVLLLTHLPTTQ